MLPTEVTEAGSSGDPEVGAPQRDGPSESGRTAGHSVFWSAIGQVLLVGVNVGWIFVLPRTLGPSHYGLLVLISSLVDLQGVATGLGMLSAFAYYFPHYSGEAHRAELSQIVTGYSMLARGLGALGACLAAVLARALGHAEITGTIIVLVAFTGVLQNEIGIMCAILYGENRIKQFGLRSSISLLLILILAPAGYLLYGLTGAVLGTVLAQAITLVGLTVVVRPWRYGHAPRGMFRNLSPLVRFGTLAMFGSLAALTLTRGGNVLLAGVGRPSSDVATFSIALGFVLQGSNLLSAMAKGLTPGLADRVKQGEVERAADWVRRAARYQTIIAVLGGALILFVGRDLLAAAVGPKYSGVWLASAITIWSLIPLSLASLSSEAGVAWGLPRLNLEYWVALSASYLVAVGLMAAHHGLIGACAGMSLSAWSSGIAMTIRLRQLGGPATLSGRTWATMLLALPFLPLSLFGEALLPRLCLYALFIALYVLSLVAFRVVRTSEMREILTSLRTASAPGSP